MLNTIDLFAGCGGLTEGFKKSGSFKMLAAVEWDKDAHNTLKHRLQSTYGYKDADARCLLFDIQKIEELIKGYELNEYPSHIGLEKIIAKDTLDLVIGGPPCQAYSVAGRIRDGNGMQDDYRNYLFESYMKVVDHFQPNACIFENVPGMLSAAPGGISIVDRISESFRKSGYVISNNLRLQATFDVSEFGVPQKRKRVIIAAFRDKSFENANEKVDSFYRALERHKEDTLNTVGRALSNLPKILPIPSSKAKESHKVDTGEVDKALDHEPRFHNDRDVKIFRLLAEDIEKEEYKYISTKALHALYTEKTGKSSSVHKYHVLIFLGNGLYVYYVYSNDQVSRKLRIWL